ncbi:helix-turn-helix transcriptional regulator [Zavarzinia compransoris]|uniref:AraC family transcriptional regulator n=1 Tax=Zavarzinia marina TaxID=2911065 RepID=UPI001F1A5A0C|nr:helix-turn-helix transcriptional regulator [Zavarzinia marina]MCF4166092.1 helix-turn-helix transcriptional regulator [Zavarzinia marina]
MPILTSPPDEAEWVDPDELPRSVVTFGFASADFRGVELAPHRHAKGQIILVQQGALRCEVEGGLWSVPPRSALWIPGGALHAIRIEGPLEGYNAFVDPTVNAALPDACRAVSVTPLLRELLVRAAHLPALYEEGGANSRLVAVLLDELAAAKVEDLHLPMPADARLRAILDEMLAAPADREPLAAWAKRAGMSGRTLARRVRRETGMSFGRWRQQFGVMLAVNRLAGGATIQQVAADLGYESVPSFATMFRKVLGTSPGRYMAERHAGRSGPAAA